MDSVTKKALVAAAVCAGVAFAATWLNYRWLTPQLEARTDWLRDMQGFLFSSIPVATAAAAALGWTAAHKHFEGQ
ncbi:MAG: hypothetical protein ACN4GZ_04095 [Acidimicrobiales bacterium]